MSHQYRNESDLTESEHDWIGQYPIEWLRTRLGYHVAFITGFAFKSDGFSFEDGVKLVRGDNVAEGHLRWGEKSRFWPEITSDLTQYVLRAGDVLIGMDGSKVGKNYARVEESDLPLLLVQRVARLRTSDDVCERYLTYLIGSQLFKTWTALVKTDPAIPHISPDDIKGFPVALPCDVEQKQIASFLDYETAKIDALIEKQQQLIALLGEKRQAVISHAVTKGLNPDAPMRDSGVEWLGEVPEHWKVKRLKHLFREPLRNGVSPQTATSGGTCTFSIAAVRHGVVNILDHLKYAEISAADSRRYMVEDRDVMMMRGNGSRDLVGSVGIVHELPKQPCIYPDILIRLRFSAEVDPRYGVFFLNSTVCRPQVEMGAKTAAGIWKVSGGTVSEFVVPVPPPEEQVTIREHLKATIGEFDRLVDLAESQEELLRERRTALISAAVTGKIDVRGWKPPFSDAKSETEMEVV